MCEVKGCKREADITYVASISKRRREVCSLHWGAHCAGYLNLKAKDTFKK